MYVSGVYTHEDKLVSNAKQIDHQYISLSVSTYECLIKCNKFVEEQIVQIQVYMKNRYTFNDRVEVIVAIKCRKNEITNKELHKFEVKALPEEIQIFNVLLKESEIELNDFASLGVFAKLQVKTSNILCDRGTIVHFFHEHIPHDIVLNVSGTKFYLLKSYLAVWSRYFDRLFFGEFKERDQKEVPIEEVDFTEFLTLLCIIYPELIEEIDSDNVMYLLKLADRFEMPSVMAMCGKFLSNLENLPDLSLMDRLELADQHNLVHFQIFCFEQIHLMKAVDRMKFQEENRDRLRKLSPTTLKNLM